MIIRVGCFVLLCSLVGASGAEAAAVAQRRAQQQQMQQQAMQQQYQQLLAQKQAKEAAAYQQAMAQKQAQAQQVAAYQKAAAEYAAYKQAAQQAVAQRAAQAQAVQQVAAQRQAQEMAAYQQAVADRQVQQVVAQKQAQVAAQVQQAVVSKRVQEVTAYQQAKQVQTVAQAQARAELNQQVGEYATYLAKRQEVLAGQGVAVQQAKTVQDFAAHQTYQKALGMKQQAEMKEKLAQDDLRRRIGREQAEEVLKAKTALDDVRKNADQGNSGEETVVDITELWNALDRTAVAWESIIDQEIKVLTVGEYIDRFRKIGVKISHSPGDYAKLIDAIAGQNPGFLETPFANVLSYAAIVDYDFDNGQNKDELARKTLGEENFLLNRKRVFGP